IDQTIEEIRDTASQSLQSKIAKATTPIVMALSGGFDSRLIAALCRDQNTPVRTLTFGRRNTDEWRSARNIAQALGLELETIHYREDTVLRHIDHHLETMEGTADLAILSVTNLFEANLSPGTSLLHGFGGDIQAGN